MFKAVIQFSLENKLIVSLLVIVLIISGIYSFSGLPIDAVPDITNNQVQVVTIAPDLATTEVEQFISFPVEQALTTIPGKTELRSLSRFGLSVVTIVFTDETNIYLARQQIAERLAEIQDQIPAGAGKPGMTPVTTGLGEIYQYTLQVKPGYASKFNLTELRTIQDWIVRRQLQGTQGVADISSFGGNLKQYEVSVNPDNLRSMGVSLKQVFDALEQNNQNAGGAYIEKGPNIWYIRTEGLITGDEEIGLTEVTRTAGGIPILVRDLAEIRMGKAIRYGAMTHDTLGETVGGIVLMLKGANSSQVIGNVKDRMAQISKTLPEGIEIEPYLDRTKLVNNAIGTVEKNLTEGALIVILVLVLLLGNLRAGLIVASVIPLAMLFAICMMRIFGVSGNLMSLGAIDFGLIVDGAVIIVEAVVHSLALNPNINKTISREELDQTVSATSGKMMRFAAFGQIIILIVYLPILSLSGIEGKMFRPMAETVSFAIIGALLLSITWVPVASSLFLSRKISGKPDFSERFMAGVRRRYLPFLKATLKRPVLYIGFGVALLLLSLFTFSRLGGEFIPQLDEGDFAVEMRLITGSSLSHTIETTNKAARILMEKFPEVITVTGKIGTSEIPTDPMPPEACDLIISLRDRDEWTSASTREELAEKMASALEVIPGVNFGFQQPIQMRFNELMTGARQDVVVKIFGEDLDSLSRLAHQVASITSGIEGAEDIYEERLTGLPQIVVKIRRDNLARYGISVADVNRVVNMAFAGQQTGKVFEGERRFALTVRLNEAFRTNSDVLEQLTVPDHEGRLVPLRELADITTEAGPVQIQRDAARRRALVGFNVRGKDVETIVGELESKLGSHITLPPGYSIEYSGQFKNLAEARERLVIAVPVALFLIFMLLYFTFGSIKYALLIFSAVPFSAIGGVFALWLRGMPFSISAGVGFIALSGVAVLNGIVLIGVFNQLKKNGMTDLYSIIIQGTAERIRPILMTATVASFGFLPMALSNSPGAEVQKPLATVVIGGLITATFLTLFLLPALYMIFERIKPKIQAGSPVLVIAILLGGISLSAQEPVKLSLNEAVELARKNHPSIRLAENQIQARKALQGSAFDPGSLNLNLMGGQYNSNYNDQNISLSQAFPFPLTSVYQSAVYKSQTRMAEIAGETTLKKLTFRVSEIWYELSFLYARKHLLQQHDSIMSLVETASEIRVKSGESPRLELLSIQTEKARLFATIRSLQDDILVAETSLQLLTGSSDRVSISPVALPGRRSPLAGEGKNWQQSTELRLFQEKQVLAMQNRKLEKSRFLPGISLGYFNQSLTGFQNLNGQDVYFGRSDRFTGYQAGLNFPLFFGAQRARSRSALFEARAAEAEVQAVSTELAEQYQQALSAVDKSNALISFYESSALKTADTAENYALLAWKTGETGYISLAHALQQSLLVKEEYLGQIHQYNLATLRLEYLTK